MGDGVGVKLDRMKEGIEIEENERKISRSDQNIVVFILFFDMILSARCGIEV